MGEPKNSRNRFSIILAIVCAILVVVIVLMFLNCIPTMNSDREPALINVGLSGRDLGQEYPYDNLNLRIEGYVCNIGVEAAFNTKLHVYAEYVTGATAIDTYVDLSYSPIRGGEFVEVNATVPYSVREELGSWILTPEWSNTLYPPGVR